jgi:hypothetical protein
VSKQKDFLRKSAKSLNKICAKWICFI